MCSAQIDDLLTPYAASRSFFFASDAPLLHSASCRGAAKGSDETGGAVETAECYVAFGGNPSQKLFCLGLLTTQGVSPSFPVLVADAAHVDCSCDQLASFLVLRIGATI